MHFVMMSYLLVSDTNRTPKVQLYVAVRIAYYGSDDSSTYYYCCRSCSCFFRFSVGTYYFNEGRF